jgi:hypothetical protein
MDEDTVAFLRKHFGEDAVIQPLLFGGWRITTRSGGEIVFTGDHFKDFIGGSDVYRGFVSAGKELWGAIAVNGPAQHIMTSLAHGEEQNAIVQPTIRDDNAGCLKVLAVVVGYGISFAIASLYMNATAAYVAAAIVTVGLGLLINPVWEEAATRAARKRGQQYVDAFPKVHAPSKRMADYDDARRKGLL